MKRKEIMDELADMKAMSDDELQTKLVKLKKDQFTLRFQQASGETDKTHRMRAVRRSIARAKMLMRARARTAAHASE